MKFTSLLAIDPTNLNEIVAPITSLINAAIPVILTLVGSIGLIWCIVLGVRYAKSEDPQEHEKAKKSLVNAIIGFVLIKEDGKWKVWSGFGTPDYY